MKTNIFSTQKIIIFIKHFFEKQLKKRLNLELFACPLIVESKSKLNDYLGLNKKPITFSSSYLNQEIEIIQSLAKWKRLQIANFNIPLYTGIYTNMNAIRPHEELDATHSLYVDQWDWELCISENDRNENYLKNIVNKIYQAIRKTYLALLRFTKNKHLKRDLPKKVFFISSSQLLELFPNLSAKQREREICKTHKVVFVTAIGDKLANGEPHSLRAYDYDSWQLNGDLLVYHDELDDALELSSMGIRINYEDLKTQAQKSNASFDENSLYYQKFRTGEMPQTIGGGIGQSRLCQYLLRKHHIGQVQASIWDDTTKEQIKDLL